MIPKLSGLKQEILIISLFLWGRISNLVWWVWAYEGAIKVLARAAVTERLAGARGFASMLTLMAAGRRPPLLTTWASP